MNQNIRNSPLAAVAFAAVALTATIPSVASAREEVVKAKVFHGDLDLATEAGVKALDRRLRSAIWQLCGSPGWSMGGVPPAESGPAARRPTSYNLWAAVRSPAPPTSASAPLPWRGTPQTVSWW